MVPSIMRAPPELETITSGWREASASSIARVTFSPTTAPIEPPMNPNSIEQHIQALGGVQLEMELAFRADVPVGFQVLLPDNRPASLALDPQPFGLDAALVRRRRLLDRFFFSFKPGHKRSSQSSAH